MPDVPTSAVFVDPAFPSHIYVGNDIGVFVSTDGGASWHDFRSGLPEVVSVLDLSVSVVNRKLRAATHGNGVYQIGLLEQPIRVNLPEIDLLIEGIQVFPNPSKGVFNFKFNSREKQNVQVNILDALGKKIISDDLQWFVGEYSKEIDLTNNKKGVYFLEIETDGGMINKKLLLQ